tara:strand:+ start:30 stop:371 length:342 start_codon:yes stop_codon:yes gene_type:complete
MATLDNINPSMNGFNEDQIQKIITSYKKKADREKCNYLNYKDNEEFKIKNRAKAKAHYDSNKDVKKEKYQNNKDFLRARSLYNYYKYNNKIDIFKTKHTEKCDILKQHGLMVE